MQRLSPLSLLVLLVYLTIAQDLASPDPSLVGTWQTKSGKTFRNQSEAIAQTDCTGAVLTGDSFYNYLNDSLVEPKLTGISYTFTADGYFEEARYQSIPDRVYMKSCLAQRFDGCQTDRLAQQRTPSVLVLCYNGSTVPILYGPMALYTSSHTTATVGNYYRCPACSKPQCIPGGASQKPFRSMTSS